MIAKNNTEFKVPNTLPNELLTKDVESSIYNWKQTDLNPDYESGLVVLTLKKNVNWNNKHHPTRQKKSTSIQDILIDSRLEKLWRTSNKKKQIESGAFLPCLKQHKSDLIQPEIKKEFVVVETQPKRITMLTKTTLNYSKGEIEVRNHITDSFKRSNYGKIRMLDKFCDLYQPLYSQKKVSLLFVTLTSIHEHAKQDIQQFIDSMKLRFEKVGLTFYGYCWTLEVVNEKGRWNPHYHLCLATERLKIVGKLFPRALYFTKLWGCRTKTTFVEYNVKHYLSKYFAKNPYRLNGYRSYGCSKKLLLPH